MKFEKYYFSLGGKSKPEDKTIDWYFCDTLKSIAEDLDTINKLDLNEFYSLSELPKMLKDNPNHIIDRTHLNATLNEDEIKEIENYLGFVIL